MVRASLPVVLVAALLCAGCPRPLGAGSSSSSATRVVPNAIAVLRIPSAARADEAMRSYVEAARAAGDDLRSSELLALASLAASGPAPAFEPFGVARDRPLLLSWRARGEVVLSLPVDDAKRFASALERLMEARGDARAPELLPGVRTFVDDAGRVALLARLVDDGALLWPAPRDAVAAAALLEVMAKGAIAEVWPTGSEPAAASATTTADLVASGDGLAALAPPLAALFGPADLDAATGALFVEGGELRLVLDLALSAPASLAGEATPPKGFCALVESAVAVVRLPVAWLARDELADGPLEHLEGQLALALFAPEAAGAPSWIALGKPDGLVGQEELLEAIRSAGAVELEQQRVAGRAVRVLAAPGEGRARLAAVVDEDLFALAFGAEQILARALAGEGSCGPLDGGGHLALLVKPAALEAVLPPAHDAADPTAGLGPLAALRRLAGRLPDALELVAARVTLADDGRGAAVDVRATLLRGAKVSR